MALILIPAGLVHRTRPFVDCKKVRDLMAGEQMASPSPSDQ